MEKSPALNDMSMTIYHKYIQSLQKQCNANELQKLEDRTAIFGNATPLTFCFHKIEVTIQLILCTGML